MRTCAYVPGICGIDDARRQLLLCWGLQVQALRDASGSGPARTPIRSTLQASLAADHRICRWSVQEWMQCAREMLVCPFP